MSVYSYDRRAAKWTRREEGGHPIFSDGTYEIHRMDATARSRYAWVVFRDGEPVKKPGRYGLNFLTGDTLAQAKALIQRLEKKTT